MRAAGPLQHHVGKWWIEICHVSNRWRDDAWMGALWVIFAVSATSAVVWPKRRCRKVNTHTKCQAQADILFIISSNCWLGTFQDCTYCTGGVLFWYHAGITESNPFCTDIWRRSLHAWVLDVTHLRSNVIVTRTEVRGHGCRHHVGHDHTSAAHICWVCCGMTWICGGGWAAQALEADSCDSR